jgi:hypothetical protein
MEAEAGGSRDVRVADAANGPFETEDGAEDVVVVVVNDGALEEGMFPDAVIVNSGDRN